jgi:hypothetical protein
MSLRGAFIASLPQHDLSRSGNLEVIDLFKNKIAEFIPNDKSEIASLRSQ